MDKRVKREVVATLVRAGRKDLARWWVRADAWKETKDAGRSKWIIKQGPYAAQVIEKLGRMKKIPGRSTPVREGMSAYHVYVTTPEGKMWQHHKGLKTRQAAQKTALDQIKRLQADPHDIDLDAWHR